MEIACFILAILIGVSLGLIGSGGSILTIPILVYIMNISPSNATTYSLFIVGVSALMGSLKGVKDRLLDFKMAFNFGLPSIISIFIMRKFFVPLLPNILFKIASFSVSKDFFIMLVFAVLMVLASITMIKKTTSSVKGNFKIENKKIIFKGILIGLLTGFVGVGGGFLIIPTLLFSARLPMKKAVATSLIIIAFNSLIGFAGSLSNTQIDWTFLLKFTVFSIIGVFLGIILSKKISNEKLKPAFGWFVLITGIYIIIKELFIK
jgi:uncharacterized membrane protein YfcA